jgi:hypothetical protein
MATWLIALSRIICGSMQGTIWRWSHFPAGERRDKRMAAKLGFSRDGLGRHVFYGVDIQGQ